MDDLTALRYSALELAIEWRGADTYDPREILEIAKQFELFLHKAEQPEFEPSENDEFKGVEGKA